MACLEQRQDLITEIEHIHARQALAAEVAAQTTLSSKMAVELGGPRLGKQALLERDQLHRPVLLAAIVGHMVMDMAVSSLALFGIIALAGVVVNDSLILVDYVNKQVDKGMDPASAAVQGGAQRFRAILLTSLTTFFGLLPILAETSMQAQMVVPMAVSLAFGILFATVITLILVPCLYNILGDLGAKRVVAAPSSTQT